MLKDYTLLINDSIERRRAIELAPVDFTAALTIARKIKAAHYRARAIAGVAEYAPVAQVESLARESFKAAAESDDKYVRVDSGAFALGLLLKRHRNAMAKDLLRSLLATADSMESIVNRCDALSSVYSAVHLQGIEFCSPVLDRIVNCAVSESSWRCSRTLSWIAIYSSESDPEQARTLVDVLREGPYKRRALRHIMGIKKLI